MDVGKDLEQAYNDDFMDGYYKGKSEAEENAEKEIDRLKAERDALMNDLKTALEEDLYSPCLCCKYADFVNKVCTIDADCNEELKWEWRGVQEEEE